jgi:hypothetical protein
MFFLEVTRMYWCLYLTDIWHTQLQLVESTEKPQQEKYREVFSNNFIPDDAAQHPRRPESLYARESEAKTIIMPDVCLRHFRFQTLKHFKRFIYTAQRVQ